MRIFLLRHAHSTKVLGNISDFDREIDVKGYEQLKELNQFLIKNYQKTSFQVLYSPAQRTKTTFESIETSIDICGKSDAHELYLPSQENFLKFLWNSDQCSEDVLVISHNNGISDLASYLLDDFISLPACGMLVIRLEGIDKLNEISKGLGVIEQRCFPN